MEAHGEKLRYLFWGVMTTLVNYGSFWLLTQLTGGQWVLLVNILCFILATAFAFVTNKAFVFENTGWGAGTVLKEAAAFVSGRLATFGLEEAGLWLAVVLNAGAHRWLMFDGIMWAKIALSMVAVVLNYFIGKYLVFHKKGEPGQ